jgi:hypothetical protein
MTKIEKRRAKGNIEEREASGEGSRAWKGRSKK